MPHIVIAFDASPNARTAVARAAELLPDARATVVTAAPSLSSMAEAAGAARVALPDEVIRTGVARLEEEAMAEAREAAEEGSALAAAAGLRAEAKVVVAEGIAWRALVDAAAEVEADAIVCGSRGHGAAVRAVLGSVASGLVRHAPVPVLVVPHEARSTTGPALVAFDGSAPASAAIRAAGRLLTAHEAVVLHVWKSTVRHSLTGSALRHAVLPEVRELTKDLDDAFEQAAQDVSDRGLAEAQEAGLRARARTFESDAPTAQAIMAVAGELDASSIVVGRRGRGAMAEALLGSVSSSLVHTSDRPVLVATS